jgi:hypothetical protein
MLDLKTINKNIRLIKDAGELLDTRIHETGVSIMQHAADHGDWSAMQRLYSALPKSGRRKAFVQWVIDFTPLKFDDKLGIFLKAKSSKREYDVQGANETPFWEYTKELVQTVNVDKMLEIDNLIASAKKRIETAIEKGAPIEGNMEAFNARVEALANFKTVLANVTAH